MRVSFSVSRWWALVVKEFTQLRRDRLTLGIIVGIPCLQLLFFGYAINTNPKQLPTAIVSADQSEFTRSFLWGMRNSDYFHFMHPTVDEAMGRELLRSGDALFVVNIPEQFTKKLLRGERPSILVEADASDPLATGTATGALQGIVNSVLNQDFKGVFQTRVPGAPPYDVVVHNLYNPEAITSYNVVPGLMGVVLTFTLIMVTALAITREREQGTMENLLAMPVTALEVICGKIIPYVGIGLVQAGIILLSARFLFGVPFLGSLSLLFSMILFFVLGNLMVGITISSMARTQMQAMQMAQFTTLPSLFFSGFLFPFLGMPQWAQTIGSVIPLTYFMRIVRGIMLKGSGWGDLWHNIWPLGLFVVAMLFIGIRFYRRTLD